MPGTISQYQQSAFPTPVNGAVADATVVLSNDNATRAKHNSHDADATIHIQSSLAANRPSAAVAQRVWATTDTGAVYLALDTGAAWVDFNYIRTTVTSLPANVLASSLTSVGILASPHMTSPVVDSGGLTVTAGTLAAQAVTATSVVSTGIVDSIGDAAGLRWKNTATTNVGFLSSVFGWAGAGSKTDAALAAFGSNLVFFTNGSTTPGMTLSSANALTIASGLTVSAGGVTVSAGASAFGGDTSIGGGALTTTASTGLSTVNFGLQFSNNAPGNLANGQIWFDGTNFRGRIGGVSKSFTLT